MTDILPLAECDLGFAERQGGLSLSVQGEEPVQDLSPLDGLTNLERFWGNHMDGLTEEEINRFTALHGGTQCVFNGIHNTSEGWREHERYYHFRRCFKHQTWIPFGEPWPET